jgi:flagellar motor switch protein FliG
MPTPYDRQPATLTGIQRAAVLVIVLQESAAKRLLARLSPAEIREIGTAMSEMDAVSAATVADVVAAFVGDLSEVTVAPHTGRKFVSEVLPGLLNAEQRRALDTVHRRVNEDFAHFCAAQGAGVIAALLASEAPQTQAVALSLMGPENAARVLTRFEPDVQAEITTRMAELRTIPGDLADDVIASLVQNCDEGQDQLALGGLRKTAAVLGKLDREVNEPIFQRLLERNQELAEQLRMRMVAFDDLLRLDTRSMQTLMRNIDKNELMAALSGAPSNVLGAFLGAMSSRAAQDLSDQLSSAGPLPRPKVEAARINIANIALRMSTDGEIYLPTGNTSSEEDAA